MLTTLGHIHVLYREAGIDPDNTHLALAEEHARKALALSPGSPRALWLLGYVQFQRGQMLDAVRNLSLSLAGAPDNPDALLLLGYVYALLGQNAAASGLFDRLLRVDPLTPINQCMPGLIALWEGRYADAVGPYRRFYEMDPDSPFAHATFAWVLAANHDAEGCARISAGLQRQFPDTVFAAWVESLSKGLIGSRVDALAAITPALRAAGRSTEMFSRMLTECYAVAGETELALDQLEINIGFGMRNYPFLAEHDWFLESLRGHPRFVALLEKVHRDWMAFSSGALTDSA